MKEKKTKKNYKLVSWEVQSYSLADSILHKYAKYRKTSFSYLGPESLWKNITSKQRFWLDALQIWTTCCVFLLTKANFSQSAIQ